MKVTCPSCNNSFPIETLTEDDFARRLFGIIGRTEEMVAGHLIAYLGLFKPPSQSLRWSRAFKLAQDALELCMQVPPGVAAAALTKTVEGLRDKRNQPGWKPLSNHNYLKRIIESEPYSSVSVQVAEQTQAPKSESMKALLALEELK